MAKSLGTLNGERPPVLACAGGNLCNRPSDDQTGMRPVLDLRTLARFIGMVAEATRPTTSRQLPPPVLERGCHPDKRSIQTHKRCD
ncbi:hypothetical protein FRC12_000600 [Ceratobasidium sp. 428]|nr:hypothetical protein FRC12_000600 [Ceratobasidium sp. 428]